MSLGHHIGTDEQLARLLQIGVVLEEVVEARAHRHFQQLDPDERDDDDGAIERLLEDAAEESADHRERLEALIVELDAESVPFGEIETLVEETYNRTRPEDFDDILYDQLHGEETAYKFYDDLIEAIENSDVEFSIDRERLLAELTAIRAQEAEGVHEVTTVMEEIA